MICCLARVNFLLTRSRTGKEESFQKQRVMLDYKVGRKNNNVLNNGLQAQEHKLSSMRERASSESRQHHTLVRERSEESRAEIEQWNRQRDESPTWIRCTWV